MGITNLLQILQPCTVNKCVNEYAGQKVAVDGYVWLHKGAYSCSSDLCQGIPTDGYIKFFVKMIKMLLYHKVVPLVVFDGGRLPSKGGTESDRRQKRDLNKMKGMEYLREGNVSAANSCFQKAVDITPQMAHNVIKTLRQMKVEYIVAPYEADAQLAFLAINHFVHAVITNDSDLVAYGCPRVFLKIDHGGYGQEIKITDVFTCKDPKFGFINWTQQMFLHMCILSGCDFLDSLPSVGNKKAHTLVKKYRDIEKILHALRHELANKMPPDYEQDFARAELTFKHQRVWDPARQEVVHLNALTEDVLTFDLSFLGPDIDKETGYLIATGEIDPSSKLPFENQTPTNLRSKPLGTFTPSFSSKKGSLPPQKSTIPNYFLKGSSATNKPFVPPVRMGDDTPTDTTAPSLRSSGSYYQRFYASTSTASSSSTSSASTSTSAASTPADSPPDDDILAPETPPVKKRVVVSRFFGSGPGSPQVTKTLAFNDANDPPEDLGASGDKTPIRQLVNGVMKLGNSPDAPITFDDDDDGGESTVSAGDNARKWSGFDNSDYTSSNNGNTNTQTKSGITVEDDVPVYASSSKRLGTAQSRQSFSYSTVQPINNSRISNSRLSLPSPQASYKPNDVQSRFGGFLQQYAYGSSSSSSSALSSSTDSVQYNSTSPLPVTPPMTSPTFFQSHIGSSDSNHSNPSDQSEPDNLDDSGYVPDSQEAVNEVPDSQEQPKLNRTSSAAILPTTSIPDSQETAKSEKDKSSDIGSGTGIVKKQKKPFFKVLEREDFMDFSPQDNMDINLHYFNNRHAVNTSDDSLPLPSPKAPSSPIQSKRNTIFKTDSTTSFSTITSTSSASTDSYSRSNFKFSTTVNLLEVAMQPDPLSTPLLPHPSTTDTTFTSKPTFTLEDKPTPVTIEIDDTPSPPAPTLPKPNLSAFDSTDGSGDDRKLTGGTKRKMKASTLLNDFPVSPPESVITRKLTPLNLFGKDEEQADIALKKIRLEPHSLDDSPLKRSNGSGLDDASDSPSGKRDTVFRNSDKSLDDNDWSASPSSKHTMPPHSVQYSSSSSSKPSPFPFTTTNDDFLTTPLDFLDQFRFSKNPASVYSPTKRFSLAKSSSPNNSPVKPRRTSSFTSSFSSSTIVID